MAKTIILTGGIGSGKTCVSEIFSNLGIRVIDADQIAKNLTVKSNAVREKIKSVFGKQFFLDDGSLNRNKLRAKVFSCIKSKTKLEKILHPKIEKIMANESRNCSSPYLIQVIPLWFELNKFYRPHNVWKIIVVDCPAVIRIERVLLRSDIDRKTVQQIIKTQARRKDRLAIADIVLNNKTDIQNLKKQILEIHKFFIKSIDES
ncbi:MAG: dephospho-CoA kinase [Betaproteobacteria bacterium TMED82]|mgnify:CR=1 FL=1|nr:MAG: dephospho-CoA kinase [Betaproteobacteria bacterium TMED82]|tara:strand:- start:56530 stop:57141 length:612 start_codon:yes stop_codon:yes gene_type:complete